MQNENTIYKEIVIIGQKVLELGQSAKDKTVQSDKLAKLLVSAILMEDKTISENLNNLFVKDAVFYGLRKIKTMAALSAVVLVTEEKVSYAIGKGDSKKQFTVTLQDAKENKWSDDIKISSIYSALKERQTGVSISDKEAFKAWCQENPMNPLANLSLSDAKAILPEDTLDAMLQEGRSYKEQSIQEKQAQASVIGLFEAFKALPPQEAHSFLIQAQAFLELQEAA